MRPMKSLTRRLSRHPSVVASTVSVLFATCLFVSVSSQLNSDALAQEITFSPPHTQEQIGTGHALVSNALPAPAPTPHRRASHRLIRKPALATITAPATAPSDSVGPSLPGIIPAESTASTNESAEQGTSTSVSASGSALHHSTTMISPASSGTSIATPHSSSAPTTITSRTASLGSSRVTAAASGSTSSTSSGSRSLQRLIADMPGMSQMVNTPSAPPTPPGPPAPRLIVRTSSLSFTATQGAANPQDQTFNVSSNVSWTVSENAPWLTVSPTSDSNDGTITARVNTAGVSLGTHTAAITITDGGITETVTVTLTLNPQSTSSATLTWTPNTEIDVAGYKVYRATSSGAYITAIATLPGKTTTRYVADGLQSGTTYFFVITAYDNAGNESGYSNEVSKSIF